jgi:hypothetical protein
MSNVGRPVAALAAASILACSLITQLDDLGGPDAGGETGSACDAGLTTCGGSCVDLSTDGRNCGACGHDCLGGGCSASACLPLVIATNQLSPFGIAVDSQRVYWANNELDASFAACPISGCPDGGVTTLVSQQLLPSDVFLANGHLYMTDYGYQSLGVAGHVLACDPANCASTLVMLATTAPSDPVAVVADTSTVYWAAAADGTISTCATSGCPSPSVLATDRPHGPWFGLALSKGSIYWTSHAADAGAVYSCSVGGCGSPTLVATSPGSPFDLAVDGTNVYWTTAGGNQVLRCPLAGCGQSPPLVIADNQASPGGIAVDASGVYWLNQTSGAVLRCDLDGCGAQGPAVLATGQSSPWEIVLDATSLYWTNAGATAGTGTIMRLAKP